MDGETSAAVAWICCDPFPPLPVGPWKPTFVVGRKGCDLELIHKEISRRHVAIHVSPSGEMSLEDLGSANGTFLRRRKVSGTVPLRPGDTILIGPYELSVSKDAPDQGVSDISSTAMSTLVSGNLKVTPMAELFSTFEHQHMSGELEVVTPDLHGFLWVQSGQPIRAEFGEAAGADAVVAMLLLEDGNFVFRKGDPEPGEREIQRPFGALLMEAALRASAES